MNKRDLPKEDEDEVSEEDEEEEEVQEQEEPDEEYVEEDEEEGIFDFDDNFNQTGKFTVNEAIPVDKNLQQEKTTEKVTLDTAKTENIIRQDYILNPSDFYIPESNEKNLEKNIKDKLDILDLDLESMPKEDLINLLLKSDEPQPQKKPNKNFQLKPKNTKSNVLNSVYSNMQNMAENKDPELAEDFNVALTKILAKMMKETNNQNAEIFDILISDRDKVEEELRKKIKIEEKVKNWIDKKNKSLEVIQEKLNEDFHKVHTFAPNIQNKEKPNPKRNFDQFWEDQINHNKKIKEKLEELKKEKNNQIKSDYLHAPKINKKSIKIIEEKLKNDQSNTKVHERLYNKRNENIKSSAILKPYNTESSCKSLNPTKKVEDRTKILYEDAVKRQNKQKELQNRKSEEKVHKSNSNSNNYILKKFQKMFKENVEKLINSILQGDKDNLITNQPLNKINLDQIIFLMQNFNFITKEDDESCLPSSGCDNPLSYKNKEKKLITEMFENLKDKDGLVNLDHLFIFCLSILNLLEYYIVKSYLENNPSEFNNNHELEEINTNSNQSSQRSLYSRNTNSSNAKLFKKTVSLKSLYENDPNNLENLLQKLNYDLNSRIVNNRKYGGLDIEGNFIITFSHAKLIFKEYNLLALNYNTINFTNKKSEKNQNEGEISFKPKINPKSKELGNKYRQKVLEQLEDIKNREYNTAINDNENNDITNSYKYRGSLSNSVNNPNEINSIHVFNMKKKKKEILNQKFREERELKEMEDCTFKPKINYYTTTKDNVIPYDQNGFQNEMRIEKLYRIGTEMLINKKDKTRDDMELERYGKECTFKPNINEKDIVFNNNGPSLNEDRDFQKFSERMKRGRIEREIKDSAFKRGEELRSPNELRNRNKSENKLKENKPDEKSNYTKKLNVSPVKNNLTRPKSKNGESPKNSNREFINNDPKQEFLDTQPRLIIDVNIRPGEKKKIFVYDGDTSDKLAEKFANENNLDENTKFKLQTLIQTQIAKLLPKITEDEKENQSIKSEL